MPVQPITEKTVMDNVGLTDGELARRKHYIAFTAEDEQRIASIREVITAHVDELVDAFFKHLAGINEAKVLLGYRELTNQAKTLKRAHLLAMVGGDYGMDYVRERIKLGLLYGRVGLDAKVFVGAFRVVMEKAGELIMKAFPQDGFERFMSFQKVAFMDIGINNDVLLHERDRLIGRQSEAIRELSTPVLRIRDRLLLLPLIGI